MSVVIRFATGAYRVLPGLDNTIGSIAYMGLEDTMANQQIIPYSRWSRVNIFPLSLVNSSGRLCPKQLTNNNSAVPFPSPLDVMRTEETIDLEVTDTERTLICHVEKNRPFKYLMRHWSTITGHYVLLSFSFKKTEATRLFTGFIPN